MKNTAGHVLLWFGVAIMFNAAIYWLIYASLKALSWP